MAVSQAIVSQDRETMTSVQASTCCSAIVRLAASLPSKSTAKHALGRQRSPSRGHEAVSATHHAWPFAWLPKSSRSLPASVALRTNPTETWNASCRCRL